MGIVSRSLAIEKRKRAPPKAKRPGSASVGRRQAALGRSSKVAQARSGWAGRDRPYGFQRKSLGKPVTGCGIVRAIAERLK